MNDKLVGLLTDLANKLNISVEHLWNVLIQGQRVVGVESLAEGIVCLAGISAFIKIFKYAWEYDDKYADWPVMVMILSGLVITVLSFLTIYFAEISATALIAPEYSALHELMGMLSK